jgi:hypothetical protein
MLVVAVVIIAGILIYKNRKEIFKKWFLLIFLIKL